MLTNDSDGDTPSADFAGADGFTYTVADGKGGVSNVVRHLLQWAKCDRPDHKDLFVQAATAASA